MVYLKPLLTSEDNFKMINIWAMKKLLLCCFCIIVMDIANAQKDMMKISLQHSTVLPAGSLRNFTKTLTARAFNGSLDYFVSNNISVGLNAGYADLYEKKARQVYDFNELDVSAVKSHSIQLIPVMGRVGYHWIKEGSVFQPYVTVGAGANFVNYQEWFGTLVDERRGLRFTASPEIGTRIAFSKYSLLGADVSLKYNYTGFKYNDVTNLQTISLNIGLFWFARD
jgi:outer membrane protein W